MQFEGSIGLLDTLARYSVIFSHIGHVTMAADAPDPPHGWPWPRGGGYKCTAEESLFSVFGHGVFWRQHFSRPKLPADHKYVS